MCVCVCARVCVAVQFFQQHLLKMKLSILQCMLLLLCSSLFVTNVTRSLCRVRLLDLKILDFFSYWFCTLPICLLFLIVFLVEYLAFSIYKIISSSNSDCFTSFFPICMFFIYFLPNCYSFLDYAKPFDCVDHNKLENS